MAVFLLTTAVNAVQGAKVTATPPRRATGGRWHGRKRVLQDTYTAATLTAGTPIYFGTLPKGAIITGGQLDWAALGSSTQLWVGDVLDCDRLVSPVNGAVGSWAQRSQGTGQFGDCGRLNGLTGMGFEYTAECDIYVTLGYAAAATGAITLTLEYVTE